MAFVVAYAIRGTTVAVVLAVLAAIVMLFVYGVLYFLTREDHSE